MRLRHGSRGRANPGRLAIGIGVGTALGAAMGKLAIGVAIGVALGVALVAAGRFRPGAQENDDVDT
jgi:hypothetical protein